MNLDARLASIALDELRSLVLKLLADLEQWTPIYHSTVTTHGVNLPRSTLAAVSGVGPDTVGPGTSSGSVAIPGHAR